MKTLGVFIFPKIQTLDLFGPIEMFGGFREQITITLVAETSEPVPAVHGQLVVPDTTIEAGSSYDLLLVPGGDNAICAGRREAATTWIKAAADHAELVMSVCTGSILLAMAGVLDGCRATTNKMDFNDTIHLGPNVDWVPKARWVHDGKYFTSSGVSAGMDMSLAAAAYLFGDDAAERQALGCEYTWHKDPDRDPFSAMAGLS
jgi:transcriptional regulator GlxA family with amidase domain